MKGRSYGYGKQQEPADPHARAPPAWNAVSTLALYYDNGVVFPVNSNNAEQTETVKRLFKPDRLCFSKDVLVRANVGGSGSRLQQTSDDSHWKFLQFAASTFPSDIWCQTWKSSRLQGLLRNRNLGAEPQRDGISSEWKSSRRARPTFLLRSGASESQKQPAPKPSDGSDDETGNQCRCLERRES